MWFRGALTNGNAILGKQLSEPTSEQMTGITSLCYVSVVAQREHDLMATFRECGEVPLGDTGGISASHSLGR